VGRRGGQGNKHWRIAAAILVAIACLLSFAVLQMGEEDKAVLRMVIAGIMDRLSSVFGH